MSSDGSSLASGGRVPQWNGFPAFLGFIFHRWRLHVSHPRESLFSPLHLSSRRGTNAVSSVFIATGQKSQVHCRISVGAHFVCTLASSEASTNTPTSCLTTSTCLSFLSSSTPPWWPSISRWSGQRAASLKKSCTARTHTHTHTL